jgi:hypothetical protein
MVQKRHSTRVIRQTTRIANDTAPPVRGNKTGLKGLKPVRKSFVFLESGLRGSAGRPLFFRGKGPGVPAWAATPEAAGTGFGPGLRLTAASDLR